MPCFGKAPAGSGPDLHDLAALQTFLDNHFNKRMKELHVPGAAFVLVKDGKILFAKGYGYADLEKRTAVDPERTVFRVASVSKLFTATAVMQLAERGSINLDDDVN
ncbi:MAG: beta-lactamase family protein, partial [Acidobacteria bacterium]|nr:beta-lactamase family protein [Acidobacteriota bacterium]